MLDVLEAALQKQLEAHAKAKDLKLKLDSYGGQLDDDLLIKTVNAVPAAWLVVGNMTKRRKLTRGAEFDVSISVLVAANSLNGKTARRGGRGGKIVGAYQLAQFAKDALAGFKADPLVTPLETSGLTNLFNASVRSKFLAVYGVQFTGRIHWLRAEPSGLDDLDSINHRAAPKPGTGTAPMTTDLPQKKEG